MTQEKNRQGVASDCAKICTDNGLKHITQLTLEVRSCPSFVSLVSTDNRHFCIFWSEHRYV